MYQSYSGSTPRWYGPRRSPSTSWQFLYRLSVTGTGATEDGATDGDTDGEADGEGGTDGDGEVLGRAEEGVTDGVAAPAAGPPSSENAPITPPQQHNASTPAPIEAHIVCRAVGVRAAFLTVVTQ